MTYRALVVDDERLERFALETLVDWASAGLTLVGSARNGVEGLGKIRELRPDVVVTDIKMPGMDGISMIREASAIYPDIRFVVLSGYGEYEYTSQAMELGVRHYALKPVDSGKILEIARKVAAEIDGLRAARAMSERQETAIERILPSAKREFFLRSLSDIDAPDAERDFYVAQCGVSGALSLLTARFFGPSSDAGRRAAESVALSLFPPERTVLEAMDRDALYILLRDVGYADAQSAARRLRAYYLDAAAGDIGFALSPVADFSRVRESRARNDRFLLAQDGTQRGKLAATEGHIIPEGELSALTDARAWGRISGAIGLYRFAALFCARLDAANYPPPMRIMALSAFLHATGSFPDHHPEASDRQAVFRSLEAISAPEWRERDARIDGIMKGIFLNLPEQSLTVRKIAGEIAYMNEDYFARFFQKRTGSRVKDFLIAERMEMAAGVLAFQPAISVQGLASLSGYPEDGQYFSKAFKAFYGKTVLECRSEFQAR